VLTTLSAGTHHISASFPGDSVLTPSVSSPITEQISDYMVQVFPGTISVREETNGLVSVNLVPLGGFSQPVQLSCGSLPANLSCAFNETSVALDGVTPSVVTLTVAVSKKPDSNSGVSRWGSRSGERCTRWFAACWLAPPLEDLPSLFSACWPLHFAELVAVPCPLRTPAPTPARTQALTLAIALL
jgi:hypothetical protein